MSTLLTRFLKEASVTDGLTCILALDHITGPIYLTVFPFGISIFVLGIR